MKKSPFKHIAHADGPLQQLFKRYRAHEHIKNMLNQHLKSEMINSCHVVQNTAFLHTKQPIHLHVLKTQHMQLLHTIQEKFPSVKEVQIKKIP